MAVTHRDAATRRGFLGQLAGLGLAGATVPLVGMRSRPALAAPGRELRVAFGAIGTNRHPHWTQIVPDDEISSAMFDPIVRYANDFSIEPTAAASFQRIGDTRWRIRLHPGITFHDGRQLTSSDVKASFESYLQAPTTKYLYAEWLDRVELVDRLTADAIAKRPWRVVGPHMAFHSFVVPAPVEDPQALARRPTGSGSYRFVEFVPNDRVVVEASPSYWGRVKPTFRRIVFRQIAETATRLDALETGEVDFATNVPPDAVGRLRDVGLQVSSIASFRTLFVAFNFALDGPWSDVRVRRALNYAVDKDEIHAAILGGQGATATGPFSRAVRYASRSLPPYAYDPARARQLMAEAGHAKGFEGTLVTPAGRYLKDREIAEAVAGQLERVGVRLRILPLEWGTYLKERQKYPLVLGAWGTVTGDADFGLRPFDATNPFNFIRYASPELQALLEQGRTTFDESTVQRIYDRAQALVWGDAPWIFLFHLPDIVAFSPRLRGFVHRPDERIGVLGLRFDT